MRYKLLFLIVYIFCSTVAKVCAQYENVWVFGNKAGIDFNNGSPVPLFTEIIGYGEANASVCDANGNLLLYTQGFYAYDQNHNFMPNGLNLIPYPSHLSVSSCAQGTQIVPNPIDSNMFYVFSLIAMEGGSDKGKLYYSLVDMNLNGGLGDVVAGNKGILIDSLLRENMIAISGNSCNFWLLVQSQNGIIKAYEITSAGISANPVLSNVGLPSSNTNIYASFSLSTSRKRISIHNRLNSTDNNSHALTICDFDPGTGIVSAPMQIGQYNTPNFGGTCFSPDNSKLYVNAEGLVYQYDLSSGVASTIIASQTTIGSTEWTQLKLAPNGKIYLQNNSATQLSSATLGVIQFPNLSGAAVQYIANAVQLYPASTMRGGLPNPVPKLFVDTQYTIIDDTADCFTAAHTIQASILSGYDYQWDNGDTVTNRAVSSPGSYRVGYRLSSCKYHIDSFNVNFPAILPIIAIDKSCAGSSNGKAWVIQNTNDSGLYAYQWFDAANILLSVSDTLKDVPAGNYTLNITTPGGCQASLVVAIPEEEARVSFIVDSIVCVQDVITFQNTSDNHFTTYSWYFGDGLSATLDNPVHTFEQQGSYEVMLAGIGPICTDTFYKTIIVDTPVSSLSFFTDKTTICTGETIRFFPESDSTTLNLNWKFGDGSDIRGPNEPVQHAYDNSGLMSVYLLASFRACPEIQYEKTIEVYPFPKVYLGTDLLLCLDDKPLYLSNLAENIPGNYRYLWNTGDTTSILQVVNPGNYSLRMSNEYDCATTEGVTVNKDCYIDVPNAFSPNGDGVNDYFFPRSLLGSGLSKFKMQIFNRWGQLIFETMKTEGSGWDGKFNNLEQPMGVYIYVMELGFTNDRQEQYKGNVTLIR